MERMNSRRYRNRLPYNDPEEESTGEEEEGETEMEGEYEDDDAQSMVSASVVEYLEYTSEAQKQLTNSYLDWMSKYKLRRPVPYSIEREYLLYSEFREGGGNELNHDDKKFGVDTQNQYGLSTAPSQSAKVIKCVRSTIPYCLYIESALKIKFPRSLLRGIHMDVFHMEFRFHISFFHVTTGRFFARTFKSLRVPKYFVTNEKLSDTEYSCNTDLDFQLFFHTEIMDRNVILVYELVGVPHENDHAVTEFGVGWTLIKPWEYGKGYIDKLPELMPNLKKDKINLKSSVVHSELQLLKGTPRVLMTCKSHDQINDILNPLPGSILRINLFKHSSLVNKSLINFIRPEDFYSTDENVPGIKGDERMFVKPEFDQLFTLYVYNMNVFVPHNMEVEFIRSLEMQRLDEQGQALNPMKQCIIEKREVVIAAHNTCGFLQPFGSPQGYGLIVSRREKKSNSAVELTLPGTMEIKQFINHPSCALILELQYTVSIPEPLDIEEDKSVRLFGMFKKKKKRKSTQKAEGKSRTRVITMGYFIFQPCSKDVISNRLQTKLITGPGRSFLGNLTFAYKETADYLKKARKKHTHNVVEQPVIEFSLGGLAIFGEESASRPHVIIGETKTEPIVHQTPKKPKERSNLLKTPAKLDYEPVRGSDLDKTPQKPLDLIAVNNEPNNDDDLDALSARSERKIKRVDLTHSIELPKMYLDLPPLYDCQGNEVQDGNGPSSQMSLLNEEVHIQIFAYKPPVFLERQQLPNSFYFKLHFFNQPEYDSKLEPVNYTKNNVGNDGEYYLLYQGQPRSVHAKYSVDVRDMVTKHKKMYANYLKHGSVLISVYDSSTHFKFGNILVPLNYILRSHNALSSQTTRSYPCTETIEESCTVETFSKHTLFHGKGDFFIRVSNIAEMDNSQQKTAMNVNIQQFERFQKYKTRANPKEYTVQSLRANQELGACLGSHSGSHISISADRLSHIQSVINQRSNGGRRKPNLSDEVRKIMKQRAISLQLYRESKKTTLFRERLAALTPMKKVVQVEQGEPTYLILPMTNIHKETKKFILHIQPTRNQQTRHALPIEMVLDRSEHQVVSERCNVPSLGEWTGQLRSPNIYTLSIGPKKTARLPLKYFSEDSQKMNPSYQIVIVSEEDDTLVHKNYIVTIQTHAMQTNDRVITKSLTFFANSDQPFNKTLYYDKRVFGNRYPLDNSSTPSASVEMLEAAGQDNACTAFVKNGNNRSQFPILIKSPGLSHQSSLSFYVYLYGDDTKSVTWELFHITIFFCRVCPLSGRLGERSFFRNTKIGSHIEQFLRVTPSANRSEKLVISNNRNRECSVTLESHGSMQDVSRYFGWYRPLSNDKNSTLTIGLFTQPSLLPVSFYKVQTSIRPPSITKTYAERVQLGESIKRRLTFKSDLAMRRRFKIGTNFPHLVRFIEPHFTVESGSSHSIRVRLDSKTVPGKHQVYVFVNFDDGDQQEVIDTTYVCFLLEIDYYDS